MYLERLGRTLPEVRRRILAGLERAGRAADPAVDIVAVTKGHPPEAALAAREAGLSLVGESRIQEAAEKLEVVGDLGLTWHMVGHLQRNKVRPALEMFGLIQSVDSLRLAREIEKEAAKAQRMASVLVQINTSGENSKYGFTDGETVAAVREICGLDHVEVVGLMTMAPYTSDEGVLRSTFRRAREMFERCGETVGGFEPRHLSMGMTNDYEIAVEEGSTMVRLGTVLFGERQDD